MTNIKEHRANGIDWLIVEVPKGATDISLDSLGRVFYYNYGGMDYRILPSGNYELIATLDEITEEQAEQVVEIHVAVRHLYRNYDAARVSWANTAKESIHSLTRSLFPEHEQHNYVILKQIKKDEQQSVYGC